MKTQNFIKNGYNFLVATFVAGILSLSITGCSAGGEGSSSATTDNPNPSPSSTKITVLDGYIVNAIVKDSANKFAVEKGKGVYEFTGEISYPVTSTGGQIDLDGDGIGDKIFDATMSTKNGGIISPLTDGTDFSSIVKGDLAFDYIKENNTSVAKLAQISYFFKKENKGLELKNVLKNNVFDSPEELAMYVSTSSDLSQNAKDAFLKIAQSDETNATKIESSIITLKDLPDVPTSNTTVPNETNTTVPNETNTTVPNETNTTVPNETNTTASVVWTGDVLNISNFSTGDVVDISDQVDVTKVKADFGVINHKYIASFDYQIDGGNNYINGYTGVEQNATTENVYVNASWGSEDNVTRLRFKLKNTETNHFDEWFIVKVK